MFALALTALLPTPYALEDGHFHSPPLTDLPATDIAGLQSEAAAVAELYEAELSAEGTRRMPAFLGRRRRPPVPWPETPDKVCRLRRKTRCKGHCPIGWRQVGFADFGCCKSFSSCGGYRKVCVKDVKCQDRRRSEHDHEHGAIEITEEVEILSTDEIEVLPGGDIEEMEAPPAEVESEAKEVSSESANSDAEGRRRAPGSMLGRRRPEETEMCKVQKTTKCGFVCPSGWTTVATTNYGRCKNFFIGFTSGGWKRVCEKELPCRRRSGHEHGL